MTPSFDGELVSLAKLAGSHLTISGKVHKVYCSNIRNGIFGMMPWDALAEQISVGDKIWRDRLPFMVKKKENVGIHYLVVCEQGESLTGVGS
jgi:hypothetical protein